MFTEGIALSAPNTGSIFSRGRRLLFTLPVSRNAEIGPGSSYLFALFGACPRNPNSSLPARELIEHPTRPIAATRFRICRCRRRAMRLGADVELLDAHYAANALAKLERVQPDRACRWPTRGRSRGPFASSMASSNDEKRITDTNGPKVSLP